MHQATRTVQHVSVETYTSKFEVIVYMQTLKRTRSLSSEHVYFNGTVHTLELASSVQFT